VSQPAVPAVGIIDPMIGFAEDPGLVYAGLPKALRDDSRAFAMPAQYMFHDVPDQAAAAVDPVGLTLGQMDHHGIAVGLISVSGNPEMAGRALTEHPDWFVGSWTVDPNEGMAGVRRLVAAYERWDIRAISFFPHDP